MTVVLLAILAGFLVTSILRNIANLLEFLARFLKSAIKAFLQLAKIFVKLLMKILAGVKWILLSYQRFKHRKELRESIFNVIPKEFTISKIKKIFSYKLRKSIKARYRCIENCFKTKDWIDENIYYISANEGKVGSGKSSFMVGVSHYRTLSYRERIDDDMSWIELIYFQIDFEALKQTINELYTNHHTASEIVDTLLNTPEIQNMFALSYSDYLTEYEGSELLSKYIHAYCAELRNNYTMSSMMIFNRITNNFNIDFDADVFNIKDEKAMSKYYVPDYCTIVDDELALSSLKNTSDYRAISSTGADSYLRLIRQVKEETVSYLFSSQNTSRIAPIVRELPNIYFKQLGIEPCGQLMPLQHSLEKRQNRLSRRIDKYLKKQKHLDLIPQLKARIFDLYQERKKIEAASFRKYAVAYSTDPDNQNERKVFEAYFPISWVRGTYKSHEYNALEHELNAGSKINDFNVKVIQSFKDSHIDKIKKLRAPESNQNKKEKKEDDKLIAEKVRKKIEQQKKAKLEKVKEIKK